jgi:hypothetical protein
MNTALIIKNIDHRLYSLEVKTKANNIHFPLKRMVDDTNINFLSKDIEMIFLLNSPTKISVWDKDHGKKLLKGLKAKKMINELGFILDRGNHNGY